MNIDNNWHPSSDAEAAVVAEALIRKFNLRDSDELMVFSDGPRVYFLCPLRGGKIVGWHNGKLINGTPKDYPFTNNRRTTVKVQWYKWWKNFSGVKVYEADIRKALTLLDGQPLAEPALPAPESKKHLSKIEVSTDEQPDIDMGLYLGMSDDEVVIPAPDFSDVVITEEMESSAVISALKERFPDQKIVVFDIDGKNNYFVAEGDWYISAIKKIHKNDETLTNKTPRPLAWEDEKMMNDMFRKNRLVMSVLKNKVLEILPKVS